MAHDAGADWIELDISAAREQVVLGFGKARAEASFPQRTAAPVSPVHVLGITLPQVLHRQRAAVDPARREQQVHVTGHETMGVHRAFELDRQLAQVSKVKRTIPIAIEAGAAVVSALNDMHRHLGRGNARTTRHR